MFGLGLSIGFQAVFRTGNAPIPGVLTASRGSFSVTGQDAGLLVGRNALVASTGTFALTGQAAALIANQSGPAAPVMALSGVSGNAATFTFTLDAPVAGDTITVQVRASGAPDWSTLLYNSTHTITQPEIDSGTFSLSAAGLGNGNYEASSIFHHVTDSGRSNVVSFSIAAGPANPRIASAGNKRIASAGNYRKAA